jgi:hypothetical protein
MRTENQAMKDELADAKEAYQDRVEERRIIKEEIINEYMR